MEEMLLPVAYQDKEMEFPIKLVTLGYTHQFIILIDGIKVTFEKDDQGDFRVLMNASDTEIKKQPDAGLLRAISEVLARL